MHMDILVAGEQTQAHPACSFSGCDGHPLFARLLWPSSRVRPFVRPSVGLWDGCGGAKILSANSILEGMFSFSHAPKMVDVPHREDKTTLFCDIFPHELNSPTESCQELSLEPCQLLAPHTSAEGWLRLVCSAFSTQKGCPFSLFPDVHAISWTCWIAETCSGYMGVMALVFHNLKVALPHFDSGGEVRHRA